VSNWDGIICVCVRACARVYVCASGNTVVR